jgi:type II restriction enzyme
VNLQLPPLRTEHKHYKSESRRAGVITEHWGADNLYCPNCPSNSLTQCATNKASIDYTCPNCAAAFQLKSQKKRFVSRINDADYYKMIERIDRDGAPNLLALEYSAENWMVRNLFLIPSFAFSPSIIEKRPPLGPHARRAGWTGCNFLIGQIPPEARIHYVLDGKALGRKNVREKYAALGPLKKLSVEKRGWTLDVLNGIRSLGKKEFSLADAYTLEDELQRLHPNNKYVRPKIRQQLQELRDLNVLQFIQPGKYRLHEFD